MTPFWSGFTEAYNKNDYAWIKHTIRKLKYITIGFIILVFIMIIISPYIIRLWIGSKVQIPFLLTLFMGLYVMILGWGAPFVHFINGVGKINLQLYVSIAQALTSLPLAIIFSKYLGFGVIGVIVAICIAMVPTIVLWPMQYKKIIEDRATGIWIR
jgi:O-antigen/teichoic acid export membrane protein